MISNMQKVLMGSAAALAITAASLPGTAFAGTRQEAALEARVKQLEAIVAQMQGQLAATQAQSAQASATAATAQQKVVSWEQKPAADGFRAGNTTIKLGGFLKSTVAFSRWSGGEVASNSLGRDFYLPSAIPVGGRRESTDNDFNAKQTRLWLNFATDVKGHTLKGYLETDFQTTAGAGSERTTNGYTLALRRGYIQFDNLTAGQDWTTFQNTAVLPESTDFVGATEGTVFVRQPLVRLTHKLSKSLTLHVSAENGETASAQLTAPALAYAAAGIASPLLNENDDDKMPDFAARLNWATPIGEFALAGLYRQLSVDSTIAGANVANTYVVHGRKSGWGVSGSGKIGFGDKKQHDLRFMVTYGKGIGRYVGLNFAPDVVTGNTGLLGTTGQFVAIPKELAALAALHIQLMPGLRSNVMASYQRVNYPAASSMRVFAPTANIGVFNRSALSYAANLFYSPVKGIDLGFEYRHAKRELVNGLSGTLNRLEFAAKYSF